MDKIELTRQRDEMFGKIIAALNDIERGHGGLFDCGALGICRVYWLSHFNGWYCQWHELERLPWEVE